ncbi:cell wall hydrolase [Aurantiacibacter odishensis]|uniref:cell wall hydrolase n=1 Tax=Aurantiacibacter odishensis TaxID=1155476 RepID=UPI001F0C1F89|nr:cell wall hydrolase [Aurantiacibacter odishensis]
MDQTARPTLQMILAERRRARAARRAALVRRLGVLAAVLAVPALAAETAFEPEIAQAPSKATQPMGFETPGQSFPGSAFYYLEEAPVVTAAYTPGGATIDSAELASPARPEIGPAAASLVAMGSGGDMVRAQECLATAIYYEAASESDAGQRAVAQVVLNRVAHSAWPNTVCGVVYQGSARRTGCQFTFTCDGSLARRPSRGGWERASRIARAALAGSVYAPVGLSTHYHTLAVNPYWAPSLTRTTVIGAHVFYRWPGAAGQSAAFVFDYTGGEPQPGRATTPPSLAQAEGPDPVALAQATSLAEVPGTPPTAPQSAPTATPAPAPASTSLLPSSGAVRSEYANSGRWIERP